MLRQAEAVGLKSYPAADPDVLSLKHTLLFGIKGVCAYADHAQILGQEDDKVYAFVHEGLAATAAEGLAVADLIPLVLKCGEINLRAMELLDAGNTGRFGDPTPTRVPLGHKKGKAILVSGHDLLDLEEILKQSAGKGIYVYTHGEMLPCHGYPKLKSIPILWPLRHRLAEPGQGIRPVSRGHPDDHQLPAKAGEVYARQSLHLRAGGLAGDQAYPGPQLPAGDRRGPGPAGFPRRRDGETVLSGLPGPRCWGWPAR